MTHSLLLQIWETSKRLLTPPCCPWGSFFPRPSSWGLKVGPLLLLGASPGSSLSSHPAHPLPRWCLFPEVKDSRDDSSSSWVSGAHFHVDVVSTLQLTITQTNEMISPSPVFRLLISWWRDPQGLEPSQWRVTLGYLITCVLTPSPLPCCPADRVGSQGDCNSPFCIFAQESTIPILPQTLISDCPNLRAR